MSCQECIDKDKEALERKHSLIQDLRWALMDARNSLRDAKADDPRCFTIIEEALNKSGDCSLEERDKRMMSKGIEAATSILGLSVGAR